jgi:hypothetical protein
VIERVYGIGICISMRNRSSIHHSLNKVINITVDLQNLSPEKKKVQIPLSMLSTIVIINFGFYLLNNHRECKYLSRWTVDVIKL